MNFAFQQVCEQLENQVNPFTVVVSVSGIQYRQLSSVAKEAIAQLLMNHLHEPVMFCRPGDGSDRYFLGPPRHFVANGGRILHSQIDVPVYIAACTIPSATPSHTIQHRRETPEKISRPPNAFIIYRQQRHRVIESACPALTNNVISKILGYAWRLEPAATQQEYKALSEAMKQAHRAMHPHYKYRPRKQAEMKRRMRRSATGIAAHDQTGA